MTAVGNPFSAHVLKHSEAVSVDADSNAVCGSTNDGSLKTKGCTHCQNLKPKARSSVSASFSTRG